MKLSLNLATGLLVAAFLIGQAQAGNVTINFDNLPPGTPVTNQYASSGVLFSSGGTDSVFTDPIGVSTPGSGFVTSTPPNLICTGLGDGGGNVTYDCAQNVVLTFTTPVDNLTFDAFGNQTLPAGTSIPGDGTSNGIFAEADVYQGGTLPSQTNVPLTVTHTFNAACGNVFIDCNADPQSLNFTGITQVVIHTNTDSAGTAYDNFSFTTDALPTPEPATLLLTGLCGIVWAGRRFLARKSR